MKIKRHPSRNRKHNPIPTKRRESVNAGIREKRKTGLEKEGSAIISYQEENFQLLKWALGCTLPMGSTFS